MTKADKNWQRVARIVADTIHTKRNELGWSVEKLAKEADLSASIIYATEAGDKLPRVENIEAMLQALGVVIVLGGVRDLKNRPRVRGFELVKCAPEDTILPVRGSAKAAGYDFYAPCDMVIPPKGRTPNLFLNVKAYMREDEYLQLKIRSSLAVKYQIVLETSGVIDADYYNNETTDGNISVVLRNNSDDAFVIHKGDRICQGIFMKYLVVDQDDSLGARRGGFGSTGK